MRKRVHKILVTGGAGFIGSAFVRLLTKDASFEVIVIDKLTYAGDLKRLENIDKRGLSLKGAVPFYQANICNKKWMERIFLEEKPQIVVHFAAESHVDRSINDATAFIETNIKGTQIIMDASRKFGIKKFIFISTDEVYGEITNGKFDEDSPIKPNSPYAASKAAADLLVQSYIRTYEFPAIIIRPSNNYGPWQYPEKLIPLAILRIIEGGKVPVYGKGLNVREWLYVDDCAKGILAIMNKGTLGEVYNLGSNQKSRNIDTVKLLLKALGVSQKRFEFVKDRLGHDLRYSLDSKKLYKKIRWRPAVKFAQGLKYTVAWSFSHQSWLESKLKDINRLYN
ncbi:MAG: dTDP-glucose 4,6-dehydratase [Candidatus Omnitrophica bacterium]|nr:dTDP-glucose 4,6-dehydratase [Candidatus Omnitrophota bacterium]